MSIEQFQGCRSRVVQLPDDGSIICFHYCPEAVPRIELEIENHNIYRLNAAGEVVWQVQRDDSNHPADWWETLHRFAREDGRDGAREPFLYIWQVNPDGTAAVKDPLTGMPPDVQVWQPGCTITLAGSAYQTYVLDPETGIAKNVTEGRPRPW